MRIEISDVRTQFIPFVNTNVKKSFEIDLLYNIKLSHNQDYDGSYNWWY